MSKVKNEFDGLMQDYASMYEKFQSEAQAKFKDLTKEFFDLNPYIKAIIWTQYTPYFNDGDECVFSVGDPNFTNADGEELNNFSAWGEYEGENENIQVFSHWSDADHHPDVNHSAIHNFAKAMMRDEMAPIMLAMFGDHCRVIATREGFDVEEYNHD